MSDTVTVSKVINGSLAQKAGFLPGDIIISINGKEINDILDYRFYLSEKNIVLSVHRGPELFDIKINLNSSI